MSNANKNNRWKNVQVTEELKITVALCMKKFIHNDNQKEIEFPSSLTSEERKYIHLVTQKMGFKSKSRGKGSSRFLTVYKKEGSTIMGSDAILAVGKPTLHSIRSLMQLYPVTNKERQDLLPATERDQLSNPEYRDQNLSHFHGRLFPGLPKVPPIHGSSEVSQEGQELPIWDIKEHIISTLHQNQVIVLYGETGSGKTTQVPQMILDDCSSLNIPCRIFCTQPRRISALTVAERVASERGEKVGGTVGYQIRLESKLTGKTVLTFCTNGILLRTLMAGEAVLSNITHIILDEVHERDHYTDFLLVVLREYLPRFRHLKVIIMSATLDITLFSKYFNGCPVIEIPSRKYPVTEYFLEDILKQLNYNTPEMKKAYEKLENRKKGELTTLKWLQQGSRQAYDSSEKSNSEEFVKKNEENNIDIKDSESSNKSDCNCDMDEVLHTGFLNGDDESFAQMLYLIMSEDVSPDYKHSETMMSSLMVASAKGRIDVIEQLLALGASITARSANNWTSADWAQNCNQQEAFDLIQTFSACEGLQLTSISNEDDDDRNYLKSCIPPDEKKLLDAYNLQSSEDEIDLDLVFKLAFYIHTSQPPGALLIFLSGYDDIIRLRDRILTEEKKFSQSSKFSVFCLHSNLQSSDQRRVFRPIASNVRKIILSTNIAETSVTINDVIYVIDGGKVKENNYDAMTGASYLKCTWISQSSSMQRTGRAGRCQPGICYHLFTRTRYYSMLTYQTPQILRTPLQDLCLHTKLLAPPNMSIADFLARAPEPPAFMAVRGAIRLLKCMDALDGWEDVTELGYHMLDLPLSPSLAKMVLTATFLKCLDPVLTIAACLSVKDPFTLPKNSSECRNVNAVRKKLACETLSDHFVYLRAFQSWQKACEEGREKLWCEKNYVSGATMEMIYGVRAQVLAHLRGSGFIHVRGPGDIRDVNSNSDNWAVVKAALISGTFPNLIRVDRDQNIFRTRMESKIYIHRNSALLDTGEKGYRSAQKYLISSLSSDWLIYNEMVRFGIVADVKTVTVVSPLCVFLFGGPMRLPLDSLSEPSSSKEGWLSSDSESEELPTRVNCLIRLDNWVQFYCDSEIAHMVLQLRYKLNAFMLRKLRSPGRLLSHVDGEIVAAIASILHQEEIKLSAVQPPCVGQKPKPFFSQGFLDTGSSSPYGANEEETSSSPVTVNIDSTSCIKEDELHDQKTEKDINKDYSSTAPKNDRKQRFFIIKVASYKQLEASYHSGLWSFSHSTQKKIIETAMGYPVVLLFALHRGNQFNGFARFWGETAGKRALDTNCILYKVEWVKKWGLSYQFVKHLHNSYNVNLDISINKDGQEVEPSIGEQLLHLWDKHVPPPPPISAFRGNYPPWLFAPGMHNPMPGPPFHSHPFYTPPVHPGGFGDPPFHPGMCSGPFYPRGARGMRRSYRGGRRR